VPGPGGNWVSNRTVESALRLKFRLGEGGGRGAPTTGWEQRFGGIMMGCVLVNDWDTFPRDWRLFGGTHYGTGLRSRSSEQRPARAFATPIQEPFAGWMGR